MTVAERFWGKVDRSDGPDACWPWLAFRNYDGYGAFWLDGKNRPAHVVAWTLTHGQPPPEKPNVLHRCDNPPCCNPFGHLFVGTAHDNTADMLSKGRHHPASGAAHGSRTHPELFARGERCRHAKLTHDRVLWIRKQLSLGIAQAVIAVECGVNRATISDIACGRTWRHVA